jgi:hypothetical protein
MGRCDENDQIKQSGKEKKMKRNIKVIFFLTMAAVITILFNSPILSQDNQADNMQILLDKIRADKKLLVAANMELTESEAKGFWPFYEDYQRDLTVINQRMARLIDRYASVYMEKTFTDDKAKEMVDELVAIQKAEGGLQATYVPKLNMVLPPKKVARYLQIENKIRAALRYDLAVEIPLVQ